MKKVPDTDFLHSDHLGGTNVTSDQNGLANEVVDFLPYGAERFRDGTSQDQRQFAGTERDQESNLDYMINRYYSSDVGRFLSQDPSFLDVGSAGFEQQYGRTLQQHLAMPQAQHSYSYALNNPVIHKDPEGEIVPLLVGAYLAFEIGLSAYDAYTTAATLADPNASGGEKALTGGGFVAGLFLPGAGYGTAAKAVANKLPDAALVCRGGGCSASQFKNASGATLDANGKLQGVSVNSASGASLEQLTKSLPHNQVGVTTVGDVRKLGGDVLPSPRLNGPNPNPPHSTLQGITPQQAENLFRPTIPNPSKK